MFPLPVHPRLLQQTSVPNVLICLPLFSGRHGKAYLFANVYVAFLCAVPFACRCLPFSFRFCVRVNISLGPLEDRVLITGLHTVCDIYCNCCLAVLGWKYVFFCLSCCVPILLIFSPPNFNTHFHRKRPLKRVRNIKKESISSKRPRWRRCFVIKCFHANLLIAVLLSVLHRFRRVKRLSLQMTWKCLDACLVIEQFAPFFYPKKGRTLQNLAEVLENTRTRGNRHLISWRPNCKVYNNRRFISFSPKCIRTAIDNQMSGDFSFLCLRARELYG